jgi:tetratricopeptide (TPR) repeat protein
MEPITTAWMMTTLLSGWLGNRGDFWLCKGANKLYERIKNRINEPANHHIQRSIRKSYLQATLMAVVNLQKQRSRFTMTDRSWSNLEQIKDFIKEQIDLTTKDDSYIKKSVIDQDHREILFPKNGPSADRMADLIQNLKESIINELESSRLRVESELKSCIIGGWMEGNKDMDFYKLTCAFFTQELKENLVLSTYIQTEYLDHISSDIEGVSIQMNELTLSMSLFFEEYKEVLPLLYDILESVEDIKKNLNELPDKTAELVLQAIKNKDITNRQIRISETYQNIVHEISQIESEINELKSQADGLRKALTQVDHNTKPIIEQNINRIETQILQKSTENESKKTELNSFVSNIIQLAKQLNQTESYDSDRLQKARALFEEGKYEKINDILNEKEIDNDIAQYHERGKVLANELTIKAQSIVLTKSDNWYLEADRLYAKALRVIENYDTTSRYAFFLDIHREILKATTLYERALKYISTEEQKALIYNNLGILQKANNEYKIAKASFHEAITILRKLADLDPQTYQYLATALDNLAQLQRENNEFDKAEASFTEALDIRRKLAEDYPQTYLAYVANTLNNLGALQRDVKEYDKAEASFIEALDIRRKLAEDNPQTYLEDVANSLSNLGILLGDKDEFDKAHAIYIEGLFIIRKLANDNPKIYLTDLAMMLNNLGYLLSRNNEFDKAESNFTEALDLRRKLAEDSPKIYLTDLAMTLNNLGHLQSNKNEFEKAAASYAEALAIYRKFAEDNPETYLSYVAITLNNLGHLQRNKNEFEKAAASYAEALAIRRKLANVNPKSYLIDYGDTAISLSILFFIGILDKEKSIQFAHEAKMAYEPFKNDVPYAAKNYKMAEDILEHWSKQE